MQRLNAATLSLTLLVASCFIQIGAQLFALVVVAGPVAEAPPRSFAIFEGPYGYDSSGFWNTVPTITLVLFLAALVANWKNGRRTLLLVALAMFVIAGVVATFLAGPIFGATASLGAVVGSLVGGRLSDVLSRRDERWLLWLPACFLAANAIASIVAFTATGLTGFVVLQAISVALGFAPFPSLIAAGQHVCGSTRRATVTAAAAVVLNAIGGSLAPLTIGALSDGFAPSAGTQSLRYAMMAISLALLPAAFAAWRGARDLPQDRED